MTGPGSMRERLTLEAPVDSDDGTGGTIGGYSDVATLWGEVVPVAARDAVIADRALARVTHRIRVRYRADLTTRHRLRHAARRFRIVALREGDATRRFLVIEAEEERA
jgi:SPP1 family predicted phage head-tail adaptor